MEVGSLLSQNGSINRAHLEADSAIDTGIKIDPVEVGSFLVFSLARLDTRDWTCVNAICYSLANVSDDGVSHGFV